MLPLLPCQHCWDEEEGSKLEFLPRSEGLAPYRPDARESTTSCGT